MNSSDNREMVDACFSRLIGVLGRDIGMQAINIIVEELGGINIHIPSRKTLEIESRDMSIRRRYQVGESYESLAFTFKLKPRHVRRIIHGE